jgi:hypothetical protein
VSDTAAGLLEMRIFTLHPGTREEFDRISREGTIPMMRRFDIEVIAFGPCLNNDDGYYLLRAFADEDDRVVRSQAIYATDEWTANYDEPVGSMIAGYQTAVLPSSSELVARFAMVGESAQV